MACRASVKKSDIRFDEVFTAFYPRVLAYVGRLVGAQDAEDIAQETFLKINKGLRHFRGQSELSTWVYRIATNAALDSLRREAHRRLNEGHLSRPLKESTDSEDVAEDLLKAEAPLNPEQQAIKREMNACVRSIIDGLPPASRTVLVLNELEGLTNKEIAEVLRVTVETVKIRLHRARSRLRKELETHCTFYRDERNELACDRKVPIMPLGKKR